MRVACGLLLAIIIWCLTNLFIEKILHMFIKHTDIVEIVGVARNFPTPPFISDMRVPEKNSSGKNFDSEIFALKYVLNQKIARYPQGSEYKNLQSFTRRIAPVRLSFLSIRYSLCISWTLVV